MRMKNADHDIIRLCGRSIRRSVIPLLRIRCVKPPSGEVHSGSSARSCSTPLRISHGMPANGSPLPGLPGDPVDPPIGAPPVMVPPPQAISAPASVDVPELADVGVEGARTRHVGVDLAAEVALVVVARRVAVV